MKTAHIIFAIAFITSAAWALFIRWLCALYHWPWTVSLISFVVIFVVTLFALALVSVSGPVVER